VSKSPRVVRLGETEEISMNDNLTRDEGPIGGMLCVFLALALLLII
jgi:hypothetical protein